MIVDRLEDTLNGGYAGLYGEVVTADTYRLRQLPFVPDMIFDVGGNVGVFARHARSLFPDAFICSFEPDPENCAHYRKFSPLDDNWTLEEVALGKGPLFHGTTARNGSGETYLSAGLGYPLPEMEQAVSSGQGLVSSSVRAWTLDQMIFVRPLPKERFIIKIDCEGGENSIWGHEPSMQALLDMDYIAMELHFYALTGKEHQAVKDVTFSALDRISKTHHCELDGVHFWATKKTI